MPNDRSAVLLAMCAGLFLVQLDVTVVNVTLPHIRAALGATSGALQWVVDAYALSFASLMLAGGAAGDRSGHRRVVMWGFGVFGAGSLACALAPTLGVLIAARALQGAGAALLLPGTLAIIVRTFPDPAEQAKAIGLWAAVAGMALPAGPLVGGLLVAGPGWRAAFLLNVPIAAAAACVAVRTVRETAGTRDGPFDVAGLVLGAATLACATFALIEASPPALAAAGALACAFVAAERRSQDPLLPLRLFRTPPFAAANAVAGTMNLSALGALFVMTLFLQVIQRRPALAAGAEMAPMFALLVAVAPLGGRWTARAGPRTPAAIGLALGAAGLAGLTRIGAASGYAALLPSLALIGVCLGLLTPAVVSAAMAEVEPARAGLAASISNAARQTGGVIGIALLGTIAGDPAHPAAFVAGFHAAAVVAAALYALAALAALAFLRSGCPTGRRPG